jgi:DHA1 family multidrug resistance protein-like MFS transporter
LKNWVKVNIIFGFINFSQLLGLGAFTPVLSPYIQSFNVSVRYVGFALSVFGLSLLLFATPGGLMADKLGKKRSIILGTFLRGLSGFMLVISPKLYQVFISFAIQGIGNAIYMPALMALLADISPIRVRGTSMSLFQTISRFGMIIGPIIGGYIAELFGLRAPFAVYGVGGFAAMIITHLFVKEPKFAEAPGLEKKTSLSFGMKILLKNYDILGISLLGFILSFISISTKNILIPVFYNSLGFNTTKIGSILTAVAMGSFFMSILGGFLSDRFGRKKIIIPAFIIMAFSTLVLSYIDSFFLGISNAILLGFSFGILSVLTVYMMDVSPVEYLGTAMGIRQAFSSLGHTIGPITIGVIADIAEVSASFFLLSIIAVIGILITTRIREPIKNIIN